MATAYTAFARHRLVCEANLKSQNISANNSVVVGALYLQSMDAYGAISAGATGQARVTINGINQYENANSTVSANQKKLLLAKNYTVGHDASGKSSPAVSAQYNVNVTFAGVYYGVVSINTWGMGALPTIPRHSSLNAISTFTVPSGCSFSISRQSNFTHNLSFWIQNRSGATLSDDSHWTWITDVSNVATSGTFNFTTAQMKTIAARLNQYGGAIQGKVKLWTNGVSGLSAQRTVQINSPGAATPRLSDFTLKAGNKLYIGLSGVNGNSRFQYNVTFKCAGYTINFGDKRENIEYTLSQADVDRIQKGFTGSTQNGAVVEAIPKLDGVQYRATTSVYCKARVDSSISSPLVGDGFSFADSNDKSIGVTKNSQLILQNVSTLKVIVPSSVLTARGFGILKKVDVAFGGTSKSMDYKSGDMVFDFGVVKTGTTSPLTVKVTDSRGLTGTSNKTVTVYPFQYPVFDATVTRRNNFEADTTIEGRVVYTNTLPSTFSYSINKVTYKTKTSTEEEIALVPSNKQGSFKITPTIINIDTAVTETVTLTVYDSLGSVTRNFTISKGKPILFINSHMETISVGNLPGQAYDGTLPGVIELEAERYHTSGKTGIQMNNSDISGINGLWFSTDSTQNDDEGIFFVKSGAEPNVTSPVFYDMMTMRDNNFYINSTTTPIFNVDNNGIMTYPLERLWDGGAWMNPNQSAVPSKPLSKCRSGWVLVWSRYDGGIGTSDTDIVFSLIHKSSILFGTTYRRLIISTYQNVTAYKALNITDTTITGARDNSNGFGNGTSVMRAVYEW